MGRPPNKTKRPKSKRLDVLSTGKKILKSPDSLPEGWTLEYKIRKSGPKYGHTYKCFVAPWTGHKCYSMQEVSRYIKATVVTQESKQQKQLSMPSKSSADGQYKKKVVTQKKGAVDGLPPGWTIKTKVRPGREGERIRVDAYYTDPETGSVFHSKKSVRRYLGIGEFAKQNREGTSGGETSSPPTTRKRLRSSEMDRRIATCEIALNDEKTVDMPVIEATTLPIIAADDHCGEDPHPLAVVNPEIRQLENGVGVVLRRSTRIKGSSSNQQGKMKLELPCRTSKRISSTPAAAMPTPLESAKISPANKKLHPEPVLKSKGISSTPAVDTPTPLLNAKISSKNGSALAKQLFNECDKPQKANHAPLLEFETEKRHFLVNKITLGKVVNDKQLQDNQATLKKLGKLKIEDNQFIGNQTTSKNCDTQENKLANQANPGNFATVAKADGKQLESSILLSFGDLDPCLEFAFKTLTGAIPLEDTSAVEDYFKRLLPKSSQTQCNTDLRFPGFNSTGKLCQTDNVFQFDSLSKPSFMPQSQNKVPIAVPGNESSQSARRRKY